jgi:hypothetical protein
MVPTRRQMGSTTWPGKWTTWWALFWHSWHFLVTSSSHGPWFLEKNYVAKDWVSLTSEWSLKVKKHAKTSKYVLQC